MLATHPKQAYLLAVGRMIERAGYYGFRSVFILYLIDNSNLSNTQSLQYYTTMTLLGHLAMPIAGLISDLFKIQRWMLLSSGLLYVLSLILLLNEAATSEWFIGVILFALASGTFTSNSLAGFGRTYFGNLKQLTAGWTLYYFLLNIGTFLGILLFGYLYFYVEHKEAIFIVAGVLFAVGVALSFLSGGTYRKAIRRKANTSSARGVLIIALTVLTTLSFWLALDISGSEFATRAGDVAQHTTRPMTSIINMHVNYYLLGGIGLVFFVLWTVLRSSILLRVVFAICITIAGLLIIKVESTNYDILFYIVVAYTSIMAITEILLMPMLLSLQTLYSNPKYLALIFGGIICILALLNKLITALLPNSIYNAETFPLEYLPTFILLVFAIVWLVLKFFFKDEFHFEDKNNNEDCIDLGSGDIID